MLKESLHRRANLYNRSVLKVFLVAFLIIGTTYIVYYTGGTELAFTHLMYIPIIVAAFFWSTKGAVWTAFLGGLMLGPFMYKNVTEKILQEPSVWMFRTLIFVLIGLVVGVLFQHIHTSKRVALENSFKNQLTGLPNANRLRLDLNKLMEEKVSFSLIEFEIINMKDINRYIDYQIGERSLLHLSKVLASSCFGEGHIYFLSLNELLVLIPGDDYPSVEQAGREIVDFLKDPAIIDGLFVEMSVKGSLVHYPQHGSDIDDLYRKLSVALDQKSDQIGFFVYDPVVEKINKERHEIITILYDALKNNKFNLVYQPKVSVSGQQVMGVEALIRLTHGAKVINPGQFIKIAEDIGLISKITEWVIKNVIVQLKKWQEEGLNIKVAVNISPNDLQNNSLIEFTKKQLSESQIDPALLEFELTERGLVDNEQTAKQLLMDIRALGMKIYLDDYGTGYNSIMNLLKLPIDYLKIDKYFIDRIHEEVNQELIESTIRVMHKLGKKVIAEGVETEEQLAILDKLSCDYIQGYYFSKPLPPEELKNLMGVRPPLN